MAIGGARYHPIRFLAAASHLAMTTMNPTCRRTCRARDSMPTRRDVITGAAAARIAAKPVKASAQNSARHDAVTPASAMTPFPRVYRGLRYDSFKDFALVTAI
jgi:hypothetical protein